MKYLSLFALIILSFLTTKNFAQINNSWQNKIEPTVWQSLQNGEEVEVILYLEQLDLLSAISKLETKIEKANYVFHTLTNHAKTTQLNVKNQLLTMNLSSQSFWIVNVIATTINMNQIQQLARMREVKEVLPDEKYILEQPIVNDIQDIQLRAGEITWGIQRILADSVWEMGIRGKGIVVGGQDTGYKWETSSIKEMYRGNDNGNIDHNYNWHDAIHEIDVNNRDSIIMPSNNPCGLDVKSPCDDHGHGTHTMGTMVGEDEIEKIGVAPESKWVGCRCMERGWGKPSTYIECFQWFAAPTDLNDENPNPAMAPHVINNSWGCPRSEGCNTNNFDMMNMVVNNVKASGVVVVVSAGNDGRRGCSSISNPAAIFESSFSVGAMHPNDTIAGFSSRGPVVVDGSGRTKPNISAPGVGVKSQIRNGEFKSWNGTSMAGPHVAGVVALMIEANPKLAGQVDVIEDIIEQTAWNKFMVSDSCDTEAMSVPNNIYGYGVINALAAVREAQRWINTNTMSDLPSSIIVYPNPVDQFLHIEAKNNLGKVAITIYNNNGTLIIQEDHFLNKNEVWKIDMNNLPAGQYNYQFKLNDINEIGSVIKL